MHSPYAVHNVIRRKASVTASRGQPSHAALSRELVVPGTAADPGGREAALRGKDARQDPGTERHRSFGHHPVDAIRYLGRLMRICASILHGIAPTARVLPTGIGAVGGAAAGAGLLRRGVAMSMVPPTGGLVEPRDPRLASQVADRTDQETTLLATWMMPGAVTNSSSKQLRLTLITSPLSYAAPLRQSAWRRAREISSRSRRHP
jgi:hypothetical protein